MTVKSDADDGGAHAEPAVPTVGGPALPPVDLAEELGTPGRPDASAGTSVNSGALGAGDAA